MSEFTVSSLHLHPIKSCRGFAVGEAALDSFGLVGDRRYLIVDSDNRFLTQRNDARLALIDAEFAEDSLVLRAPHAREFRLSLESHPTVDRLVTIFRDTVMAGDMGDAAASWFSAVLGQPCRLVRAGAEFARRLPAERIPPKHAGVLPEVPVAFVDAFPILVMTEASLEHLNTKLETPLPMNRFRPNIVLRGAAAHEEDRWNVVRIGGVEFRAGAACGRCLVTTTNQETGERGAEPLVTLACYRRDERGAVTFGQYWMPCGPGTIRVGDAVEIVS